MNNEQMRNEKQTIETRIENKNIEIENNKIKKY
jgi:hypothetical protein